VAGKYGQNTAFVPPNRGPEAESYRPHVERAVRELFPGVPVINVLRDPEMTKQVEDLADLYRRSVARVNTPTKDAPVSSPQPQPQQSQPFRIRRESDGKVFRYDNPVAVPKGFVQIGSPLDKAAAPTEKPLDVAGQGKNLFLQGLERSDRALGDLRTRRTEQMTSSVVPEDSWLKSLIGAINPVPGDTAEAVATIATAPIKGSVITGPLKRAGAAALSGGLIKGVQGEDPTDAALRFGASQLAAEIPGAVIGGIRNQRKFGRAQAARAAQNKLTAETHATSEAARKAAYDAAVAQDKLAFEAASTKVKQQEAELNARAKSEARILDHQDKIAHDAVTARLKREFEEAKLAQAQAFQQMKRTHAQQGAARIADHHKQSNPAWAEIASDETGLTDMVYGRGPKLASDRYEASFQAAMERAKGVDINLSPKDALALGFPVSEEFQGMAALPFEASRVMQAMTGKSQQLKGTYRRAAAALDAAGVGDPAARAEYKSSMALIDAMEKSKALEGGQYHPDRMLSGLTTTLPKINAVRHRGEGDALRGPLADSTVGIPQKPGPLAPPTMPAAPMKRTPDKVTLPGPQGPPVPPFQSRPAPAPVEGPFPGFTTRTIPAPQALQDHPFPASVALGGIGHYGFGLDKGTSAALSGGLLAALTLGNRPFATRAPTSALEELTQRLGWTLGGGAIRGQVGDQMELPDNEP
jgi:hypothetical protein